MLNLIQHLRFFVLFLFSMKKQGYTFVRALSKFAENQIKDIRIRLSHRDSFFYFYLRTKTTDLKLFSETFFNYFPQEYLATIEHNSNSKSMKRPLIVDVGACIGTTAALFSISFPSSYIVALEPSSQNYKQLKKNTKSLENIECFQLALDSQHSHVKIYDANQGFWGLRTEPADTTKEDVVETIGVEKLLESFNGNYEPFIFKLDIEGGERYLKDVDWDLIVQFKIICIEFHDWLFPSEGLSKNFFYALARNRINYSLSLKGNNMWIIKL